MVRFQGPTTAAVAAMLSAQAGSGEQQEPMSSP